MNSLPHPDDFRQPHSTLAPSERHLEDWIVANPGYFAVAFCNVFDSPHPFVIKRQPSFPVGRPDLIMSSGVQFIITELKKSAITFEVLGQCARYMHDLRQIASRAWWTYLTQSIDIPSERILHSMNLANIALKQIVKGCVVGHSVSDPNILFAAHAMSIDVLLYEWDSCNQAYFFQQIWTSDQEKYDDDSYYDWANGGLGIAINQSVDRYITSNFIGGAE